MKRPLKTEHVPKGKSRTKLKIKTMYPEDYIQSCREHFGKIIQKRREEIGYSQVELAGIMDVQRSAISRIENGKSGISIDYIVKLAWFLDFEIELHPKETLIKK